MLKNNNSRVRKLAVPLTSLVILFFLILQTIASFNLTFGPLERSPFLWPFLDYPMYSAPHYKGDKIIRHVVFGTLEDSTEVRIRPQDLGLHYWLFRNGLVLAMLAGNKERIKVYGEIYRSRHNKQLIGLRLENHPLVLSRHGVNPGPPQVLKNFRLEPLGGEE